MFAVKPGHHPKAGIGHQVFSWMGSRLLSERAGADFYHTPFESPRSGGGWDGFFGFGEGFETDAPEPHENLPGFDLRESKNVEQAVSRIRSHSGTTRTGKNCFPGVLSSEMRGLVSNMQSSYQQLHGGAEGPECALHIRRGDIHPERNANRWIALNRYESFVRDLHGALVLSNFSGEIEIHTEPGRDDDLSNFPNYVDVVKGGDPKKAFRRMAAADVLVTGKSSFSILAGYVSSGLVLWVPLREYTDVFDPETNIICNDIKCIL